MLFVHCIYFELCFDGIMIDFFLHCLILFTVEKKKVYICFCLEMSNIVNSINLKLKFLLFPKLLFDTGEYFTKSK